jgi:hypothetical protein
MPFSYLSPWLLVSFSCFSRFISFDWLLSVMTWFYMLNTKVVKFKEWSSLSWEVIMLLAHHFDAFVFCFMLVGRTLIKYPLLGGVFSFILNQDLLRNHKCSICEERAFFLSDRYELKWFLSSGILGTICYTDFWQLLSA